jgi:hypothetical protein
MAERRKIIVKRKFIRPWTDISVVPGLENYKGFSCCIDGGGTIRLRRDSDEFEFKVSTVSKGYLEYKLPMKQNNGKLKHFLQHRLIAFLWISNPGNKPYVDHIKPHDWEKGETVDNSLTNLRWATRSENSQNSRIPSTNTSGERNIYETTNHGKPVWCVGVITANKPIYRKRPRDPNSKVIPQYVIELRDELLKVHGQYAVAKEHRSKPRID